MLSSSKHLRLVATLLVLAGACRCIQATMMTLTLPENRELKRDFGYHEDTYLNSTELTQKYGYASEEHYVMTQDGYVLSVLRLRARCRPRRPVLLVHGLLDSADLWLMPAAPAGLAYALADRCHDVWALNHRGNSYSRRHRSLDPDRDLKFWDYSFEEHGLYDLPAVVDYIIAVTGVPKLFLVAHSQGTTDFLVMASLRPEYNEKIQLAVLLAPVAWMRHVSNPILRLLVRHMEGIKKFADIVGVAEILGKRQPTHSLMELFCHWQPAMICETVLGLFTGYRQSTISKKTISVGFGHMLNGESMRSVHHLGQLMKYGRFQRYDGGKRWNLRKYGSSRPPEYDVSKVAAPVVLVNGANDHLSTVPDVQILRSKLPNIVDDYMVPVPSWSHHNHLWGRRANKFVYPKIWEYFKQFETYVP